MMGAPEVPPNRGIPFSDLITGLICLAGCIAFLVLAFALPAGHSTGDVGPGALPKQIGIFGIICSAVYLLTALRGGFAEERPEFTESHRALAAFAIFAICLAVVPWLGLAPALALAAAVVTLLFAGRGRLVRAAATAAGVWLIAVLLFERLLGLPLP
ncbi:tripartite tricarboxylate transporter TctB family protein [Falsirhodobacter sp. 20TX0035]|uniref:tripartite tricarboxylate transporter TctB family protein n=1 Tax=Falsirhodobacter sp. 20TX0035 TaxID=3022019 RepID=UPI00232B603A|nr:tripartite tricarboxylate transporter TctB family protein [Falsirhodobacter sp. 20TX0035]MDB6454390.1 tripartite tricarboxylate transporter TctB family protein [Falsirhodobacter sp. 20TX0035]